MNVLGVTYYRFVKENGSGSWYQVYVKSIFDNDEVKSGEIFGVLGLVGEEREAEGHKLLRKIDNIEEVDDLGVLTNELRVQGAVGGFVRIYVGEDGERKAKAVGVGGARVGLLRKGKLYWLVSEDRYGPVVGSLKEGDKLLLLSEGVLEKLDTGILAVESKWQAYIDDLIEKFGLGIENDAMAGIMIAVGKYEGEEIETSDMGQETKGQETRGQETRGQETRGQETKGQGEIETGDMGQEEQEEEKEKEILVTNKLVGKVGIKDRFEAALTGAKQLLKKQVDGVVVEDEQRKKRKKIVGLVGVVFLVLLIISVVLGTMKSGTEKAKASFENEFAVSIRKLGDAESNFALNPSLARDVVNEVLTEIETKKGMFEKQDKVLEKIDELKSRAEKLKEKVSGEVKVNLELYFGLEIVRPNMKASAMGGGSDGVVVIDTAQGIGVKLNYTDKKPELVLGRGESSNWDSVSWSGDLIGVAGDTTLSGVVRGEKKEVAFDSAVGKVVAMDGFGANLYLLDQGSSEVWKYSYSGGEFSGRQRWLAPGVQVDLSKATDLVIDGDVWIASDQSVIRLRRGNKERYVLEGIPDAYKVDRLTTNDESKWLVVLDKNAKRLLVMEKETGVFVKQLVNDDLARASDLVMVEPEVVMIAIEGGVYKLKI